MIRYNADRMVDLDINTQSIANRLGANVVKMPGWVVGKKDQSYIGMYLDLATNEVKRTLADDSPHGLLSRIVSKSLYPPSISTSVANVDESIQPWDEKDVQSVRGYNWLLSKGNYY